MGRIRMKEVVFNNGIEAIAHVRYGTMGKSYSSTSGLHTLDMKNIIIPEGVEYIGGIYFHEKCETLTLPSSLIEIGEMKPYSIGFRKYDLKNLKKIRINRTEPPFIEKYNSRLVYEQIKHVILSVPKGSKEAYSRNVVWRLFNIIEEGEAPVVKSL